MRISEGWLGAGALTPFKNHKAIRFRRKAVSNPLRNHKAFTVVPSSAHLRVKNENKNIFIVGPPLKKISGSDIGAYIFRLSDNTET